MIVPREYQLEALEAVAEARIQGVTRQLISLPTGCGKTVVFALLAKELNTRTLILAHTEELIHQAVSKFKIVWPEVDIGVVKAEADEIEAQVVVASIQTASKLKRLSRLKEQGFGLMIIDEAHHATAPSYATIIEELGFFRDDPHKLLVGVTATPKRGDGIGLGNIFQEIVFERSMHTMIRSGYLSPLNGKQVFTKVELAKVGTRKGDFVPSELSKIINTPERNRLMVENYTQYALDRKKALAFCVDVQHAKDLSLAFKEEGIAAQAVYGSMSQGERVEALSGFANGQYKVLTNCQLLTEGFDDPEIDCVIMGRPTQSSALFTQMVGRGTRTSPLKEDCLVLDFTDNATKHQLCTYKNTLDGTAPPLFDLPRFPESITEDSQSEESPELQIDDSSVFNDVKILEDRVEEISFFDHVHFAWNRVGDSWHLILSADKEVWVVPLDEGFVVKAYKKKKLYLLSKLMLPLDYALGVAEDWARKQTTKSAWARKDATWRSQPATQKQKEALSKCGIHFDEGISKGRASQLLDSRFNEPATIKQVYWLRANGVNTTDNITKIEARKMISERAHSVVHQPRRSP